MIIKDIGLKEAENIRKVLNFSNFRLISCTIILTYIKNVKSYTWGIVTDILIFIFLSS